MKKWIEKIDSEYGSRFTRREKKNFVSYLDEEFAKINLTKTEVNKSKFLRKSNTLIYGNVRNAKVIFTIPYDTPSRVYWNKQIYYPLNGEMTQRKSVLPLTVQILSVYFVLVTLVLLASAFSIDGTAGALIQYGLMTLTLLFIFKVAFQGFKNKKNANRNNGAIALSLALASILTKEELNKVAFAYTDSNTATYIGVQSLGDYFKEINRNPLFVTLNANSFGDELVLGYRDGSKKEANSFNKGFETKLILKEVSENNAYLTTMQGLKRCLILSAGKFDEKGNFVAMAGANTKDTEYNEALLNMQIGAITKYIKEI